MNVKLDINAIFIKNKVNGYVNKLSDSSVINQHESLPLDNNDIIITEDIIAETPSILG